MAHTSKITITDDNLQFAPADYKITYESLASPDSGRSDDGTMHLTFIRSKLVKLEITLPPHRVGDPLYSSILSCVQGQEYELNYYDYLEGKWKTSDFYTSNSSADWYSGVVLNGIVQDVTFSAIEKEGAETTPTYNN